MSDIPMSRPPLRRIVLNQTGQDLRRCQSCSICDDSLAQDADIPLSSLVQLILLNDEEVLTCRTLWSDATIASVRKSCQQGFDLAAVMLALRTEAVARGIQAEVGNQEKLL